MLTYCSELAEVETVGYHSKNAFANPNTFLQLFYENSEIRSEVWGLFDRDFHPFQFA